MACDDDAMRFEGHHEVRSDVRHAVQFRPLAEVKRFQSRTENAAPSDFSPLSMASTCLLYSSKPTSVNRSAMAAQAHVWTALDWQVFSFCMRQ
jgi:hypothetical protein